MDFLPPEIDAYSKAHTTPENAILAHVNRQTHLKVLKPRMLSGHMQGRFLSMISNMLRPSRILEIGTFTGYSALCLAEGLAKDGVLYTVDNNDELEEMVQNTIHNAGMDARIQFIKGDAKDVLPTLAGPFDLVFIDADKINYSLYYDLVFDKLQTNGWIIADNVLWSGKVVENKDKKDEDRDALCEFNKKIQNDTRVENILVPFRDGLMICRKL